MSTINANDLFQGSFTKNGFIDNITIDEAVSAALRSRRDLIRERIRSEANAWSKRVAKDELFAGTPIVFRDASPPSLKPKFRMQGSQVYGTANDPACKPPQEIDLDDGLFLPIEYFERSGARNPMVASQGFFELIEAILAPLCDEQGWDLDTDHSNCIRIRFLDGTHYDVALYAIANEEYQQLVEARLSKAINRDSELASLQDTLELENSFYDELKSANIKLANRNEGWIDSDPRLIEDWFKLQKKLLGNQIVRISRYLKAWRDYEWETDKCALSSIALMECAVRALHEVASEISQSRDDIALSEVTTRLPAYLRGVIPNPVPGLPDLNEGWSDETVENLVEAADRLNKHVQRALGEGSTKQQAIRQFGVVFGSRIPDDTALIKYSTLASAVQSYQPAKQPQPNVERSRSG